MARFNVYVNPEGIGYLLDVQADLLDGLNTRIVVPLLPRAEAPLPAKRLNLIFVVDGRELVMVTQFLSAVPRSILTVSVMSLEEHRTNIIDALDMLLQGF